MRCKPEILDSYADNPQWGENLGRWAAAYDLNRTCESEITGGKWHYPGLAVRDRVLVKQSRAVDHDDHGEPCLKCVTPLQPLCAEETICRR